MSYGHNRNTGIKYLRNYEEAKKKFESTKPIRGKGANGGKIALGHRHRAAEFYMEMRDGIVECYCYRTPVVSFYPDGNIKIVSGGWSSSTTANFISEALPVNCRVSNSELVVNFNGGEYKIGQGLLIGWVDGRLTALNVEPECVYRVKRKVANNVRLKYAEFIKYFNGMIKVRENGMVKEEEFENMFGGHTNTNGYKHINYPNDVSLRNKEQIDDMFAMIESDNYEVRYKACLQIIKQFGRRHYWKENGYSIDVAGVKRAMNNLIFARHKDEVFEVVELPLGTIKKDSWAHLF